MTTKAIDARSDETRNAAQPERRERGAEGMSPNTTSLPKSSETQSDVGLREVEEAQQRIDFHCFRCGGSWLIDCKCAKPDINWERAGKRVRALIRHASPSLPTGMVAVPVEPTEEMIEAGDDCYGIARGTESWVIGGCKGSEKIWSAMLAAALSPPPEQHGESPSLREALEERADQNWMQADYFAALLDQHGIAYDWPSRDLTSPWLEDVRRLVQLVRPIAYDVGGRVSEEERELIDAVKVFDDRFPEDGQDADQPLVSSRCSPQAVSTEDGDHSRECLTPETYYLVGQDSARVLTVRVRFPFDIDDWAQGRAAIAPTPDQVDPDSDADRFRRYEEMYAERDRISDLVHDCMEAVGADCYRVLRDLDQRLGRDRVDYGVRHARWRRTREGERPSPRAALILTGKEG